jgi:hypothetical protein
LGTVAWTANNNDEITDFSPSMNTFMYLCKATKLTCSLKSNPDASLQSMFMLRLME